MLATHMTNFSQSDTAHKFKKEDFIQLSKTDYFELSLFLLYMLGKIPEYRVVSGLMMVNTQNAFMRICEQFGGQTVTLPTIQDVENSLKVIQMYNQIDIQNMPYEQVVLNLQPTPEDIVGYTKLKTLLISCGVILNEDSKDSKTQ